MRVESKIGNNKKTYLKKFSDQFCDKFDKFQDNLPTIKALKLSESTQMKIIGLILGGF